MKFQGFHYLMLCAIAGVFYGNITAQSTLGCTQNARISLASGETNIVNCLNDDESLTYRMRSRPLTMAFGYLVTDENDRIIEVLSKNFLDLESYGEGRFRVYSFSYIGDILNTVGQDAKTAKLATLCHGLSINFISVFNSAPDAGEITTDDGERNTVICATDVAPNVINFATTNESPFFNFVVTNDQNQVIAVLDSTSFDFTGTPLGTYRVWGVAHLDDFSAQPTDNLPELVETNDCWVLSERFAEVTRLLPQAGSVSAAMDPENEALSYCLSLGDRETLAFTIETETPQAKQALILTDENNTIIGFQASADSIVIDESSPSIVKVWGLVYTGTLTATIGQSIEDAQLSDDCFDRSNNAITIVTTIIDGGTVAIAEGGDEFVLCIGQDVDNTVTMNTNNDGTGIYSFVITDALNQIVLVSEESTIDLSSLAIGNYQVYGVSYAGVLNSVIGTSINNLNSSENCLSISTNSKTVLIQEPIGGSVAFEDGSISQIACVGDLVSDFVTFESLGAAGESFVFVITDDNNRVIKFTNSNTLDFENIDPGTCKIWGLSYFGNLLIKAGDLIDEILLTDRCYDLSSNFISVTKLLVDGGTVALTDGSNLLEICAQPGVSESVTLANTSVSSLSYTYLLIDAQGNILSLADGSNLAIPTDTDETCQIVGLSYSGTLEATTGQNVNNDNLASECYELSTNQISITKEELNGGTIAFADGAPTATICPGDGRSNILSFQVDDAVGESYAFLVTDFDNQIIYIADSAAIDFDTTGLGVQRIWGLAYSGNLTAMVGTNAANNVLSDECYQLSDNFILVQKVTPDGGQIRTLTASNEVTLCPENGNQTIVVAANTSSPAPYSYLITNGNDIVVNVVNADTIDFSGFPAGNFRIYGLSYTGDLTAVTGDNINISFLADDCFEVSTNFIAVNLEIPSINPISFDNNQTVQTICLDEQPNNLTISTNGPVVGEFLQVIVELDGNTIVDTTSSLTYDFNGLAEGRYLIFGLAYFEDPSLEVDQPINVDSLVFSNCITVSDQLLLVNIVTPEPGSIAFAENPTMENMTICSGDSIDVIRFEVTNPSIANFAIVVANNEDEILSVSTSNEMAFANLPNGMLTVYGVFYSGVLTASPGTSINSPLSDDCSVLSSNSLSVTNIPVNGGRVDSPVAQDNDAIYLCDDQESELVLLTNNSPAMDANYSYVITNESGLLLAVVDGDQQDFESTGFRRLRVYGVSHDGPILFEPLAPIETHLFSATCFDLSDNFLQVFIDEPIGGSISTINGDTTLLFCPTPEDSSLSFVTDSDSEVGYVYLLTDTTNTFLAIEETSEIDLVGFPEGPYRVWGLSYTGLLNDIIGFTPAQVELATNCHELSQNFVTVNIAPLTDGGRLSLLNEPSDTIYTCPGDGSPDLAIIQTTSNDENYQFVLANDNNEVIIPNLGTTVVNFEGAAARVYHIWGIAYNGTLDIAFGDQIETAVLSDSCWDLSSNFLRVVNEIPDGGQIAFTDGLAVKSFIVGDNTNFPAPVEVTTDAPNAQYAMTILDNNGSIIDIQRGKQIDLSTLPLTPGNYFAQGFAYTGQIDTNLVGQNFESAILTTGCFDLSDNQLTVNIVLPGMNTENNETNTLVSDHTNDPSLRAVPNPTKESFVLQFVHQQSAQGNAQIQLWNSNGTLIKQKTWAIIPGLNELPFHIDNLPGGLYLVRVKTGHTWKTIRVLKH